MRLMAFRKIKNNIVDTQNNKLLISLWGNEELSLPVIRKLNNGNTVDTMFIYTKPSSIDSDDVGLPTAIFDIKSSNGEILNYHLCDDTEFEFNRYKPLKYKTDIKNRDYNVKRLLEIYDTVREFVFNNKVSSQETLILAEYKALFFKTAYRDHIPYYLEIGKEFFNWVDEQLN